ncbi:hypothetical protein ACFOY2_35590 [Nonomuraea purpurea]|uniref:Uncharacterized protein n=1 Tax=Nonomuraea purpurea TaxID=1849276 RepID=A0ABV8GFA4_9ACTN
MNTTQPPATQHSRPREIIWEWSPFASETLPLDGIEHGYIGRIRAFSLVPRGRKVGLRTYLPNAEGRPLKEREFPDSDKAKMVAHDILKVFMACLLAAPETHQQASKNVPGPRGSDRASSLGATPDEAGQTNPRTRRM